MDILIPMSGAGKRFADFGYEKPKPLIEFFGKTMIEHVLDNLNPSNTFTICVLKSHYDSDQDLFKNLGNKVARLNIVIVDSITSGAAATCLLAKKHINPENSLMIANCDQMMIWDQKNFENWMSTHDYDGSIFVFDSDSPKNSYVEIDEQGVVTRTAEKEVISPYATTGLYFWTKGIDFIHAAENMIRKDLRVNNEFYVCPVYNEIISRGSRIGIYRPQEHWPIGTPEDLEIYIKAHS